MPNIENANDLQDRVDAQRGYLANRNADARTYTVHDLAHFCNARVQFTPNEYPKYWAENINEFTQFWGPEGEVWNLCGNCRSKRDAARRRGIF